MEREDFLNRIATRLGRDRLTSAPVRDVRGIPTSPPSQTDAERLAKFTMELEAIGGHVTVTADVSEALKLLVDELAPTTIITWGRGEFAGWGVDWLWDERKAVSCGPAPDAGGLRETMLTADVGITTASFAIADTGTLLLATSPTRPRSVSLVPTVHIALVRQSQLVDRMGDALSAYGSLSVAAVPSSVHFISGPSRSADIENDLTIGVHGPAALHVIVGCG